MHERLTIIKQNHTGSSGTLEWRALTPIGEVVKVRIELLIDVHWEWQIEYKSVEKELH